MDKSMEDATRYISAELKADPSANINKLIEEACRKFDLDPMHSEMLINKYILSK